MLVAQYWGMKQPLNTRVAGERRTPRVDLPVLLVQPRGDATVGLSRLKAKRLRSARDIRTALGSHGHRALWVTPTAPALRLLLGELAGRLSGDQRLLSLVSSDCDRRALLHALFRFVVSAEDDVRLLPIAELVGALNSTHRTDVFVGVASAHADNAVILYRGNLDPLVVPLAWFKPAPGGLEPDACEIAVTDFGQTICLGKYEASAAAILYEFDGDYRRRAKRRLRQADRSLGGALRRLRLQKGLRQSDFPGLTAKEIARIERGEVKKPHQRTLAKIARRIGVRAEEIATY